MLGSGEDWGICPILSNGEVTPIRIGTREGIKKNSIKKAAQLGGRSYGYAKMCKRPKAGLATENGGTGGGSEKEACRKTLELLITCRNWGRNVSDLKKKNKKN